MKRARIVASIAVMLGAGCIHDLTDAPPSTCSNGASDPGEADVDCGGACAARCALGAKCASVTDCDASAIACDQGRCAGAIVAVWEQASPQRPPIARFNAGLAFDALDGRVRLFGGSADTDATDRMSDLQAWDGAQWTTILTPDPFDLAEHAFVGMPIDGRILIYGGVTSHGVSSLTMLLDGDVFYPVTQMQPPARSRAAAAFDPRHNQVVLAGGRNPTGTAYDDAWTFDGLTRKWTAASSSPGARADAVASFDAANRVVVFGGEDDGSRYLGDTWTWDGSTWIAASPAVAPSPRSGAAIAYDEARRRAVLFGGASDDGPASDTWEWDGATWTHVTTASSPPARKWHAMTFDIARRRIVLFGGGTGGTPMNDTWEYHAAGNVCDDDDGCDTKRCVRGICCQTACGPCSTCSDPGSLGVCVSLPAGTKRPGCDGICDGKGQCE